ncbi:hypothetical protein [Verrucosispora sp. WMMC514]|nr:hypothetical protein [Verrucosispora sp. WMMC514]WBB89938.1 hypothetical protein O7597_23575 [Verrucosispora sp. WMMC514]
MAGLRFDQGVAVLPPLWSGAAPTTLVGRPTADILNRQFHAAR